MKTSATRTLRAGLTVAVLLGLAACGGIADDAPTRRRPDRVLPGLLRRGGDGPRTSPTASPTSARPTDISDEERNGFEVYVEGLQDEGDSANRDVSTVQIPADDQADGKAFVDYASSTCARRCSRPSTRAPPLAVGVRRAHDRADHRADHRARVAVGVADVLGVREPDHVVGAAPRRG